MLRTIGFSLKIALLSTLVLILGNWVRWDGKTISDQVKLKMAHAERTHLLGTMRGWAEKLTQDARKGIQRKAEQITGAPPQDEISSSERQKLKALIRELNSSHKAD